MKIGGKGWRPTEVHPAAAVFPMMPEDELAALADDIAANGLINPIVIDDEGRLIDGRNRDLACARAKFEPRYEQLNGRDAEAYIVSINIERRNLSKSQQAMALAMIYPEPGRRGVKSLNISRSEQALVSQARSILRHSIDLARDVMAQTVHFDVALQATKKATQSSKSLEAQMAMLRGKVPDVAAMVTDGRKTLAEGLEELGERQRSVHRTIAEGKAAAKHFSGLGTQLTIIEVANSLTDADLTLVEADREDADPLRDLPMKEVEAARDAVTVLLAMRETDNGE